MRRRRWNKSLLLASAFVMGCEPAGGPTDEGGTASSTTSTATTTVSGSTVLDSDEDGVPASEDCDDSDPAMPADDADCDGVPAADDCDDSDASMPVDDADCDGVLTADDCDDSDPSVYPGAPEIWGDGVDQDCDGVIDVEGSACSADFVVTFSDGTSTELDGCEDWDFDASFEYDPDDPPEVIDFSFLLGATTEADFDCRIELLQQGVCGPGFYDLRDGTTSVTLVTLDCSGVDDDFEGTYEMSEGYLEIRRVDAGPATGSFADEPLLTTLEGHLHVWQADGLDLEGRAGRRGGLRPPRPTASVGHGGRSRDAAAKAALGAPCALGL